MITNKNLGPVKLAENPDFPLHDLCTVWEQASDIDMAEMITSARALGGIFNDPSIIWEGKMLDGRNRQLVCKAIDKPMEYREFTGSYEQAREYVIAKNFARRHNTAGQRALALARMSLVDEKFGFNKGNVAEHIAEELKCGVSTAKRALRLATEGDENAQQRVLRGDSSLQTEIDELTKGSEREDYGDTIPPEKQLDLSKDQFTDVSGQMVPEGLMDLWRSLPVFNALRMELEGFLPKLRKLIGIPAGDVISTEYIRHLKDLSTDLDGKQPAHICPHCHGSKQCVCPLCKKRWAARGEDNGRCHCCNGKGYLMKEEPYPDKDWVRKIAG